MDAADGDDLHIWWLGQSGFLFKQAGAWLLVDPYLSDSLTLKYAATDKPHVRMTERCIEPDQLRFVPVIASSHQHTDHFDEATLMPLANARSGLDLVLPAAVETQARSRLSGATVTFHGIDSGTSVELHGWHIQGVAAAHNEVERDERGRCKFLGFVIRRNGFTLYHSGDTLLHPGLANEVPTDCDVMFLPINGNKPERRVAGNMNGREAALFASSMRAKLVIPHHFDMFTFNTESPATFVSACQEHHQPHKVMSCGERLSVAR
ncbi:MAG: MBL fold metallo-hydrolase [Verrucomicrobiaceae bacterium]|nr:MBL fold metallo-hydrolase [Verrucomicrobiaceae bacterium]